MQTNIPKYTMRISRLTIDKLGIQMYDRVSAVLAELIANSYDADAEHVTIALPFGKYLAQRTEGQSKTQDLGFEIAIEDDGSGMTADEVNKYYLNVGYNRRVGRGERTPKHQRRVMGRKGIGKLAPFGICHELEIVSAGGERTARGYQVSNLILNFDDIRADETGESENVKPYHPKPGRKDGDYADSTGTKIILRYFDRRRVPTGEELDRQLAARFGLRQHNWNVTLENSVKPESIELGTLRIDLMEGTRINVDDRPVNLNGQLLPVSGWVAYAKDPYKDEVMAGVRLYARGKIVAQTRDFDVRTGFTGEFKMRSYLTGAIEAEWLDEDDDLIRTDRQDIIWHTEVGNALREWGQNLLKELARKSETSAGRRVWDIFLEESQLIQRLDATVPSKAIRDSVVKVARSLVTRADRDSVKNPQFVERVVRLAFSVGPHGELIDTLHEVAAGTHDSSSVILALFEKIKIVEMHSLGQVAQERVDSIRQLRELISSSSTDEPQLQKLVENAPWILFPDWTPLSFNQTLASTRSNFESWYRANHGREIITSAMNNPSKRPDFVMLNHEGRLEVVEIKRPQHSLTNEEFNRAFGYLTAMRDFVRSLDGQGAFANVRLTIVCDRLNIDDIRLNTIRMDENVVNRTWHNLLQSTSRSHQDFLKVVDAMQGELPPLSVKDK